MFAETRSDSPVKPVDPEWAWAPYKPDSRRPWNLPRAGHLYRRAGFGANWDELQRALADGPRHTVDRMLHPEADIEEFNRGYDDYEAAAADSGSGDGLRAWWLRRMIHTPHPLLEKMTLFWHNHFAISNLRVGNAPLIERYLQLLRSHALGPLAPLWQAVWRDPAVLLGTEAAENRKALPNENFARALLEHFGPGPGNFGPGDVTDAARALTGCFVRRGRFRFLDREHDSGVKKILGQQGNWGGDDAVRIVLAQPATSKRLVEKLYRWLISETDEPGDTLLAPLAELLAGDHDFSKLVEKMLRSNLFFSDMAYRQRVKSPVEFAVGIVRAMEGNVPTVRLGQDLATLGQDLCCPPTIKGWPTSRDWINSAALVGRSNLALALLSGSKPYGDKLDPAALVKKHGCSGPARAGRFMLDLFLQGDLAAGAAEDLRKTAGTPGTAAGKSPRLRRFVHAVVTLPEFQLA